MSLTDELVLTDDGRRVVEREPIASTACGIDRWLGGVHLTGHGPVWRWDDRARRCAKCRPDYGRFSYPQITRITQILSCWNQRS